MGNLKDELLGKMGKHYPVADGREPQVGDWVRFYQGGILIIAIVSYIREAKYYPFGLELCTDRGTVNIADVIEARRDN